jgi:hypothetical protein
MAAPELEDQPRALTCKAEFLVAHGRSQFHFSRSNPIGQHLYPDCGLEEVAPQVHYAMRL